MKYIEEDERGSVEYVFLKETVTKYVSPKRKCVMSVSSPADVYRFLKSIICDETRENFVAMWLDNKNNIMGWSKVAIGSVNEAIVHPREIFRDAIKANASSIIVSHNHPSGQPYPSKDDIITTKRLIKSGKIVGIELLDHVIVSQTSFKSLKEEGYMDDNYETE